MNRGLHSPVLISIIAKISELATFSRENLGWFLNKHRNMTSPAELFHRGQALLGSDHGSERKDALLTRTEVTLYAKER